MEQLALDLGIADGPPQTVLSPANADAFGLVERWPHWPYPVQLVHGPCGSGKSHLARAFVEASGGALVQGPDLLEHDPITLAERPLAVDDAQHADETALFHVFNAQRSRGNALLLTAASPMAPCLADLRSRLRQVPELRLHAPDDALIAGVMRDAFTRRQLPPDPAVIAFLLPRMERTLHQAVDLVALVDRAGLAARRGPTRPLAARVLSQGSPCSQGMR